MWYMGCFCISQKARNLWLAITINFHCRWTGFASLSNKKTQCFNSTSHDPPKIPSSRWWFQILFIFTPIWGIWSNLTSMFFKWVCSTTTLRSPWGCASGYAIVKLYSFAHLRGVYFSGTDHACGRAFLGLGPTVSPCFFVENFGIFWSIYTPGSTNIAGWNMYSTRMEDVFPIENGDIPASYVSLPEGTHIIFLVVLQFHDWWL